MKAPFPYFGGKSRIADQVWSRFGNTPNYVEPFAGSLAVLLSRPDEPKTETVNDLDCYLSNFWRAVQAAPDEVAEWANWPVNEADLSARHLWLLQYKPLKVQGDPDYFDAKIAGWWLWGICAWIGGGWCSGKGPWESIDGELTNRKLPHLGDAGRGINRKLPHLGTAGQGIKRTRPYLGNGMGINRVNQFETRLDYIKSIINELSLRLRNVRVCCGDWTRIMGPTPTTTLGLTGVFLDPPYADTAGRRKKIYTIDSQTVAHDVRAWAVEHGDDPKLRIALCGYEGEHEMPPEWECVAWKAQGGFGSQGNTTGRENSHRERIWFSPHCLKSSELSP